MVGVDMEEARSEVRRAASRPAEAQRTRPEDRRAAAAEPVPERPAAPPLPDLRDPRFALERETLKLVVQHPGAVGRMAKDVDGADFTHPTFRAVWEAVTACGGPASAPGAEVWVAQAARRPGGPARP